MRDYSGKVIGARPKARLVDAEQEPHEYDEHMSEKLTGVPKFVLPHSHSEYTIEPSPSASSLSDLKSRWVLLKQKVIAHKSHDGWRIGKVWKQGVGKKYGGMIWVTQRGEYMTLMPKTTDRTRCGWFSQIPWSRQRTSEMVLYVCHTVSRHGRD